MSRSNQKEYVKNPAEVDLEWSGSEGAFHYYDKQRKEKVNVPMPIRLAVLDELNAVRGWSEEHKSNIFSNETHNMKATPLTVKCFDNNKMRTIIEGYYHDIMDKVKSMGGKYNKVLYALTLAPAGSLEGGKIVRIYLKGAAAGQWINKPFNAMKGALVIDGVEEGQKGAVRYKMPVFKSDGINDDEDAFAIDADKQLQAYLKQEPAKHDDGVPDYVTDEYEETAMAEQEECNVPF